MLSVRKLSLLTMPGLPRQFFVRTLLVLSMTATGVVAIPPSAFCEGRDFSLSVHPSTALLAQGARTTFQLEATSSGPAAFTGPITLSAINVPPNVSVTFKPSIISPTPGSRIATVEVSAGTTLTDPRELFFTVVGEAMADGRSVTHRTVAHLTVKPTGAGTISGIVRTAHDQQPIGGLTLRLGKQAVLTDEAGNFVFPDPPAGPQLLKVDEASLATKGQRGHLHAHPV